MPEYYVTFGDRERREEHPTFPPAHPDGWVKVTADSLRQANRAAYDAFGFRWSTIREPDELTPTFYPLGELGVLDPRTGVVTPTEQEANNA